MRYVLDASVATCWFFEDEHDARADAAAALLLASGSAMPLSSFGSNYATLS